MAGSSIHSDCSPHTDTHLALEDGLRPRVNMPANETLLQRFSALVPGQPDRSFKIKEEEPTVSYFLFFLGKF